MTDRRTGATRTLPVLIGLPLATASGLALWLAMRLVQAAVFPLAAALAPWVRLALNAGIEEGLRLALAVGIAFAVRAAGLHPGAALLGVAASCALAAAENVSYLAAFPTADVYWRLGYALPVHAGAAALYALALAPWRKKIAAPENRPARRIVVAAAAFAAAWCWHSLFNIAAALFPFPGLPAAGTALNLVALLALLAASERAFVTGGHHGRRLARTIA